MLILNQEKKRGIEKNGIMNFYCVPLLVVKGKDGEQVMEIDQ